MTADVGVSGYRAVAAARPPRAGHHRRRTIKLYDPTGYEITLDEVERIKI